MSLASCARCWDTPCGCGEAGYLVSYNSKLPFISDAKYQELKLKIEAWLEIELKNTELNK